MTISPRLLDGFSILVAQMKRKEACVTNKRKFCCFHFQKSSIFVKPSRGHLKSEPKCNQSGTVRLYKVDLQSCINTPPSSSSTIDLHTAHPQTKSETVPTTSHCHQESKSVGSSQSDSGSSGSTNEFNSVKNLKSSIPKSNARFRYIEIQENHRKVILLKSLPIPKYVDF